MPTRTTQREQAADSTDPEPALDGVTSYEDGAHLVVCATTNPNAWIRSDLTVDLEP